MIDIGITSEECHVVDTNLIVGICVLIQTLGNILYFRSLIGAARVNGNQIGNQPAVFQRIVGIGTMDEEGAAAYTCQVPLIIFLICLLVFWLWLHKTHAGRNVFLIGQSPRVALYSAIPVNRTLCALYAMTGLASAVAAVLLVSYFGSARSDLGASFLMPAITAVVLGGANIYGGSGSIIGTAIAVLLVGYLQQGLQMAGVPNQVSSALSGALLIVVVVGRSVSLHRQQIKEWLARRANNPLP